MATLIPPSQESLWDSRLHGLGLCVCLGGGLLLVVQEKQMLLLTRDGGVDLLDWASRVARQPVLPTAGVSG